MNLILVSPEDFVDPRRMRLGGRRFEHVRDVHRVRVGDRLRVGEIDGKIGDAEVTQMDDVAVELEVADRGSWRDPPPALPVTLCVALSRPPTVAKVLSQAAAMGVKHIVWFHAKRVEKSYWQSSALTEQAVEHQLRFGLEQGVDTVMPRVELVQRFLPFAEDRLPALLRERGVEAATVAHPGEGVAGVPASSAPRVWVLGPEGGLIDFEVDRLVALGAELVALGPRILRVETAAVAVLARSMV